jgi:hypothetical protein
VGKWTEGGWVVLIVFALLILFANLILISPAGYRAPKDIHRIIREKSRVQGAMGNIVEWQSLKIQEYRYKILYGISRFFALLGIIKPVRFEKPIPAGEFEEALKQHGPETFLDQYLENQPRRTPKAGGAPSEVAPPDDNIE